PMKRAIIAAVVLAGAPLLASAQVAQTPETAMAAAEASGVCGGPVISARWVGGRVIATCRITQLGGNAGAAAPAAAGLAVALAAIAGGGGGSTTTTLVPTN